MSLARLLVYYVCLSMVGTFLILAAGCAPLEAGNPACVIGCTVTDVAGAVDSVSTSVGGGQ